MKRLQISIFLFLLLAIAAFALLGWRLFVLQYVKSSDYAQISQRQQNAVVPERAQRGFIVDARGRLLAASNISYTIFVEPRRLTDLQAAQQTALQLSRYVGIKSDDLLHLIQTAKNPGYLPIQHDIDALTRDAILSARIPAVAVEPRWKRFYPSGSLTAHVVGFLGADQTALAGLELYYDKILKGVEGRSVYIVDALRRPIAANPDSAVESQDGYSLILTLDATVQEFVRSALQKKIDEYQAESGIGIVMNPYTGAILAMVSLPDFDPEQFSKTDPQRMKNRVLLDVYEPGSIIKPIAAAIALDNGSVGFNESFDCENGFWARYRIGEFGNHRYGVLSVREILIHSSNVGMAKIGLKMGNKKLYDGMRLFGFGEKTGIDLPGEEPGVLHPIKNWSGWSVTRIPFGHEISVTALQMARAYCILANGGSLVRPHVVRAIVDRKGQIVEYKQPTGGIGYVIKPEVARWIVQQALVGVVNEGTGDQAKMKVCQVWGKTGTANIALPGGGYDTTNYVASFVGGAPADKPAVVVMVSIRRPNRALGKGYSGGRVAAPVVREILENTLPYLGVIDYPQPEEQRAKTAAVR